MRSLPRTEKEALMDEATSQIVVAAYAAAEDRVRGNARG